MYGVVLDFGRFSYVFQTNDIIIYFFIFRETKTTLVSITSVCVPYQSNIAQVSNMLQKLALWHYIN